MALFDRPTLSGIFSQQAHPTWATLAFERPTRAQNSAGEVVLSFASSVTVYADLQPQAGGLLRALQGQVDEVQYTAVVYGTPDVQVGDRTQTTSALLEVINADRYGAHHVELILRWVR